MFSCLETLRVKVQLTVDDDPAKRISFPNVNHYSQSLRFVFFLSKCLISLPSPSPWCLRWWWIFRKISCCVTYFHRVWSPGGDWWINIHFTSNNNLSSLSPDGTTSLGPSVNFVKVLVPMSYSYLAMAVGSVDFGEARGSIPNATGWKTDQRANSYENFAKGRVSFQRGILPQKKYFTSSDPHHDISKQPRYIIWLVVKMSVPGLGANTSFPLGPAS